MRLCTEQLHILGHTNLSSPDMPLLMIKCTEISCSSTVSYYLSNCFEACGVQRFHLQEGTALKSMSCYITFKKKTSTCGSHLDCSVGHWVNRCDPWPLSTLLYIHEVIADEIVLYGYS